MQRQYNIGLNSSNPGTISLAVDKNRLPKLGLRGPERAWPGDDILRNRRLEDKGIKPPPRYSPAYTSNVSHLVV